VSAKKIVDEIDIARRYLAGESPIDLSKSLGVGRNLVVRRLLAQGVVLRTQSEAEVMKQSRIVHVDSRITINRDCEYCRAPMTRVVYPSQNLPHDNRFCSTRCSRLGTPATSEAKRSMAASGLLRWANLTEEQRDELTVKRIRGLAPYLCGKKRTTIELMVERVLTELNIVFIAQLPVSRAVLDFYIPSLHLNIECDGDYWHSLPKAKTRDHRRDWWLKRLGYTVVRITETDIRANCRARVIHALTVGADAAVLEVA
jgi:very-short-patch-repair endonuclease